MPETSWGARASSTGGVGLRVEPHCVAQPRGARFCFTVRPGLCAVSVCGSACWQLGRGPAVLASTWADPWPRLLCSLGALPSGPGEGPGSARADPWTDCWPFGRWTTSWEKAVMTATARRRSLRSRRPSRRPPRGPGSARPRQPRGGTRSRRSHPARGARPRPGGPGEGGPGEGGSGVGRAEPRPAH